MRQDEIIRKLRDRIEMCRRLTKSVTDANVAAALRQIAAEAEAEIRRLSSGED